MKRLLPGPLFGFVVLSLLGSNLHRQGNFVYSRIDLTGLTAVTRWLLPSARFRTLAGHVSRQRPPQLVQETKRFNHDSNTNRAPEVNLNKGQIARIPRTDLTIEVTEVRNLTAEGCLGGPVGCRDRAEFKITRGNESKAITLYAAHTEAQRKQGVNRAEIFGYRVKLIALHNEQVTLRISNSP